jgi:hypothetical protein
MFLLEMPQLSLWRPLIESVEKIQALRSGIQTATSLVRVIHLRNGRSASKVVKTKTFGPSRLRENSPVKSPAYTGVEPVILESFELTPAVSRGNAKIDAACKKNASRLQALKDGSR